MERWTEDEEERFWVSADKSALQRETWSSESQRENICRRETEGERGGGGGGGGGTVGELKIETGESKTNCMRRKRREIR